MPVIELEQGSPEWLEFRNNHLGASDCPIVLGLSPYKTPYQLWRLKTGLDEPEATNANMAFGHKMEPFLRDCFIYKKQMGAQPAIFVSESHNFLMASLDGLCDNGSILEIKCNNRNNHESALNGIIPPMHMVQVQHQLFCTESDHGYYLSYHKDDIHILEFNRDEALLEEILAKETEFWETVTNKIFW